MKLNRKTIITILVVALVALAGCSGAADNNTQDSQEDIANSTGEDVSGVQVGGSYYYEVKVTEKNQMGLVKAQPPFVMEHSLERQNLIKRYKYLNDRNNVHHVYLMDEGQVVAYYVAQGKVSSVNSKLTNDRQIVKIEGAGFDHGNGAGGAEGPNYKVVESPQMDGSYGTNGDAIFFFTTSGKYVQTSLDYVVSEEPMNIQDEIILVQNVDDGSNDSNENSTDN